MHNDCVFCEVLAGKRAASRVYESADVLAFMDLRQFNPGHVLVIPRRHIRDIFEPNDAARCQSGRGGRH